jgi:transposase-like protein
MATVVAVGVNTDGWRQVLGIAAGPSEDHAFWTSFLRSLLRRGLKGVALVVSDAHEGLKQAIAKVLHGATWQRSSVLMASAGWSLQSPVGRGNLVAGCRAT